MSGGSSSSSIEWIDTHTHLDHEYPFSLDEYFEKAKQVGVHSFITIGTDPGSLTALPAIAEKYSNVFFTLGVHPHDAKDYTNTVGAEILKIARHPKCVAIGEIGLDFHYNHSTPEQQVSALVSQLELAETLHLPVVIHSRMGETELLTALRNHCERLSGEWKNAPGIIHCFSGTWPFAQACLELGFFISISGIVTFKKADELRAMVAHIPLNRLLLETDAPFLAPEPYRGKPNHSAYLLETAKVVARVQNRSLEELAAATTQNARTVFRIGTPS